MSYDTETAGPPYFPHAQDADPQDLELLVAVLELAAIYLTEDPTSTFTAQELIDEAHRIGGDDIAERDLRIVLGYVKFLKRERGRLSLR